MRPFLLGRCRSSNRRLLRVYPSARTHSPTLLFFRAESTQSSKPLVASSDEVVQRVAELGGAQGIQEFFPRMGGKDLTTPLWFTRHVIPNLIKMDAGEQVESKWIKLKDQPMTMQGRVEAIRVQGSGLFFIDLQTPYRADILPPVQVMVDLERMTSPTESTAFKECRQLIRRGDWIVVKGNPGKTSRGQWSILAHELPSIISPSMHNIPRELSDPEAKIKNRHLDLIVNPQSRAYLYVRDSILQDLRYFFKNNGFLEVSTPLLAAQAGGAVARPFLTRATEFGDQQLSLRIAPELWLKRLIIGGIPRVFEIGPSFRNEGVDAIHNPEFTTCEFYASFNNLNNLINKTWRLFKFLGAKSKQPEIADFIYYADTGYNFFAPFAQMKFIPSLERAIQSTGVSDWQMPPLEDVDAAKASLLSTFEQLQIQPPTTPNLPRLLGALSEHYLEPQCKNPTFITHHPEIMSPLAKSFPSKDGRHRISARAELFIGGIEYVNCYEEENSPFEQRRKFEAQAKLGGEEEESSRAIDESYLSALEYGMPPTGGWGMGVDRLVMLFAGKKRIADVLPFGNLRHVVGLSSGAARTKTQQEKPSDDESL